MTDMDVRSNIYISQSSPTRDKTLVVRITVDYMDCSCLIWVWILVSSKQKSCTPRRPRRTPVVGTILLDLRPEKESVSESPGWHKKEGVCCSLARPDLTSHFAGTMCGFTHHRPPAELRSDARCPIAGPGNEYYPGLALGVMIKIAFVRHPLIPEPTPISAKTAGRALLKSTRESIVDSLISYHNFLCQFVVIHTIFFPFISQGCGIGKAPAEVPTRTYVEEIPAVSMGSPYTVPMIVRCFPTIFSSHPAANGPQSQRPWMLTLPSCWYSNRRNKFILQTLNKILIEPQDRDFK